MREARGAQKFQVSRQGCRQGCRQGFLLLSDSDNLLRWTTPWPRPGLDSLLDLHGQTLFVDDLGTLGEVRRGAERSQPGTATRPKLLIDAPCAGRGQAGRVRQCAPGAETAGVQPRGVVQKVTIDTGLRTIRPYEYGDAATLLEDFWREVDEVLRERGSLP